MVDDDNTPVDITPMGPAVDRRTREVFEAIEANLCRQEERQGGPDTYSCSTCLDRGSIVEFREVEGDRIRVSVRCYCEALGGPRLNDHDPEADSLRETEWTIDGDLGRSRLRLREDGLPTLWIHPDGRRCSYDGKFYRPFAPISRNLYSELYDKSRRAKRLGPPELVRAR
jgi:hypothetical protein